MKYKRWTLECETCGKVFHNLETWQVDGEATAHSCPENRTSAKGDE
jgi:hypothetical protein